MKDAIDEVFSKPLTAARLHGVLHSIVKDRLSGRVIHGRPKVIFNCCEEEELTGHFIDAASIGYDKTWKEVLSIVERYAEKKEDAFVRAARVTAVKTTVCLIVFCEAPTT